MKKIFIGMVVFLTAAAWAQDVTNAWWAVYEGKVNNTVIGSVETRDGFDKAVLARQAGNILLVLDENSFGSTNYVDGETINALLIPMMVDGETKEYSAKTDYVQVGAPKMKDNKPIAVKELVSLYLTDLTGAEEHLFVGTSSTTTKYTGTNATEKISETLSGAGVDPDLPKYGVSALRYNQALSANINGAADPAAGLQAYVNAKLKKQGPAISLPQVVY